MTLMFRRSLTLIAASVVLAGPHVARAQDITPLFVDNFEISLWPGGVVNYKFLEAEINLTDRTTVELTIRHLNDRFNLVDPANPGRRIQHVRFKMCDGFFTPPCPPQHLEIRNNRPGEGQGNDSANTCRYYPPPQNKKDPAPPHLVGYNGAGLTFMRLEVNVGSNTIAHELLHCLGVWHEQDRKDAATWLIGSLENLNGVFAEEARQIPSLGNFDYDSIMLYGSYSRDGTFRYRDRLENAFRRGLAPPEEVPSRRDMSRVLQYYAHERQTNWGFFFSLGQPTAENEPLDPYLAPNVHAVGSPAIVYRGNDDFDLFVRGSDERIYWKFYRTNFSEGPGHLPQFATGAWTSLGCCFASEPAAISRADGEIDVVAVGATTAKLQRNRLENGRWQGWSQVQDGYPAGGLKTAKSQTLQHTGYLAPAVASRIPESLDVFAVRADGRLAVTTLLAGGWSTFVTLGQNYEVTARPAAVAISATDVRMAINEGHVNLYEPLVQFPPATKSVVMLLGAVTATTAIDSAPALTRRSDVAIPYRVLITNAYGRLSHRLAGGAWRDIGGIPRTGSGPAAVATSDFGALILMNGEDVKGCAFTCLPDDSDSPNRDAFIQPGGLWLRRFR